MKQENKNISNPITLRICNNSYKDVQTNLFDVIDLYKESLWIKNDSVLFKNGVEISLINDNGYVNYKSFLSLKSSLFTKIGFIRLSIIDGVIQQAANNIIVLNSDIYNIQKKLEDSIYKKIIIIVSPHSLTEHDVYCDFILDLNKTISYKINKLTTVELSFYPIEIMNLGYDLISNK